MLLEMNKAIVRRWIEEMINNQNLAVLDELVAYDFYHHTAHLGVEEFKKYVTMLFKGFPDWHVAVKDIIAEGDKVWVLYEVAGTHTGEYRGLAPTDKNITATSVNIYRVVNGKVVEVWRGVSDLLDFYKQLGVIEYKGFPDEVT